MGLEGLGPSEDARTIHAVGGWVVLSVEAAPG